MGKLLPGIKSRLTARLITLLALVVLMFLSGRSTTGAVRSDRLGVRQAYADTIDFNTKPTRENQLLQFASDNHIALLEMGLSDYQQRISDYTCTLVKQERIGGKMRPEQQIEVKFKESPFSVVFHIVRNAGAADKIIFVEGANDNKFLAHPTGLTGLLIPKVSRAVDDAQAAKASLRRVNQFGFARSLRSLLDQYESAAASGDLTQEFLGTGEVDGRATMVLARLLPPKPQYPYNKVVIHLDRQYLVPTATFCYNRQGQLEAKYIFSNVQFNTGLSNEDFLARNNGM